MIWHICSKKCEKKGISDKKPEKIQPDQFKTTEKVMTAIPMIPQGQTNKDPGIVVSLLWLVGLVLFQIIGILLAYGFHYIVGGANSPMLNSEVTLIFGILIGSALMIATRANYLCRHLKPVYEKDSPHRVTVKTLMMTLAVVAGSTVFAYLYQMFIIGDQTMQPEVAIFKNAMDEGLQGVIITFLAGAVAAPVLEELLFRGQLQGAIGSALKEKVSYAQPAAIAITAAIFALIHFQPLAIPPLFVAGCAFGWVRWKTGSLALPIVAHMLLNGFSLSVLYTTGAF